MKSLYVVHTNPEGSVIWAVKQGTAVNVRCTECRNIDIYKSY